MAGQIVQRALILHADDGTREVLDLKAPEVLGPVTSACACKSGAISFASDPG